jgi:hypothetical protein
VVCNARQCSPTSAFRAADFDGDGDQDLPGRRINAAASTGTDALLQNLGAAIRAAGAIGASHRPGTSRSPTSTGNGALDVFQANKDSTNPNGFDPSVLYLNAGGGATAFPTSSAASSPRRATSTATAFPTSCRQGPPTPVAAS